MDEMTEAELRADFLLNVIQQALQAPSAEEKDRILSSGLTVEQFVRGKTETSTPSDA